MNNSGRKQPGTTPQGTGGFGELKNQGRNGYSQNSGQPEGQQGRNRSNAVFTSPTQEAMGRARSNAIFSHQKSGETGPEKPINQGRNSEGQQDSPKSSFKPGNLGRNSYQSAQQNRNGLTPNQQAGFNLVSGFMSKLIEQADRNGKSNNDPDRRIQQNQFKSQEIQDKAEEQRQRANSQMSNRDDDNVTAQDFFKRLGSALADPEGFKKRVAEKEAGRKNQQQQQRQETTSPPQQNQEQPNHQQRENITGKEFFQRLQGALKDPQGFKRRVEAQQNQQIQKPNQPQQQGQNRAGETGPDKPNPSKPPQGSKAPEMANQQRARRNAIAPTAKPRPRPKSK